MNAILRTFQIENLRLANTPLKRLRGLLGEKSLARNAGLLIVPANSIHTFFMRFAIDVIFLNRENIVIKIYENLPAWRFAFCWRANAVLELAAGAVREYNIKCGDTLAV